LRAFKRSLEELALKGRILATDVDPLAPALYEADGAWIVPYSSEPGFIPALGQICQKEGVALVFPLIDPDVAILSQHAEELERISAKVVVVSSEASDIVADKVRTHGFFQDLGLRTPKCWLPRELETARLSYPVFIKPRFGSGSEHTFKVHNARELSVLIEYVPAPIVQEFLPGPEITSDVVCDLEGSVLAVVSRRRIAVRGGEVAKGVSVYDPEIADGCVVAAKALKARGPITIQCMMNRGHPYFTEINARFGGGCPLAFAAGVDAPKWFLALAAGLPVEPPPMGSYETDLYLARCDESIFVRKEDLEQIQSNRF
jgi:carbamoyl-phosphate synthase large subunit